MAHIQQILLIWYIISAVILGGGIALLIWSFRQSYMSFAGAVGVIAGGALIFIGCVAAVVVGISSLWKADLQSRYYKKLLAEKAAFEAKAAESSGAAKEAYEKRAGEISVKISFEEKAMTVDDWDCYYKKENKKDKPES